MVALLGHPVSHSVSPQIHNAAFAAAGVDAVYAAFDVAPSQVGAAVGGIAALGLLGANITVPHKQSVFGAISRHTPAAAASGAVNTLFWDDGELVGDNTDVAGLAQVLRDDVVLEAGAEVLLLGAGGAARAVALALGEFAAALEVVARRADAASAVEQVARAAGVQVRPVAFPTLVINATPLSLTGQAPPRRFVDLGPGQTALDLVYAAEPTAFVLAAEASGARGLDGRGMLLGQAAAAFTRWTGLPAPVVAMAEALERSLRVI